MTYNGWSNYETWVVKLIMDNEESSARHWGYIATGVWEDAVAHDVFTVSEDARITLADILKADCEDGKPELTSPYAELLNAALEDVDWLEIADNMLSDTEGYERRD